MEPVTVMREGADTMRQYKKLLSFLLLLMAIPMVAMAGGSPLVETGWLSGNLGKQGLVVLDVRAESNYRFAHIPGAVNLPYRKWEPACESGCQYMAPVEGLQKELRRLGLNMDSRVVVYGHGNTASDASKAAAVLWVLDSLGVANTSMLNGGFTKWTFEGRKVDNKIPSPPAGDIVLRKDPSMVATVEDVKKAVSSGSAWLVDARAGYQHFGHTKRADVQCFGHIPGSINLPADFLTNAGINRAPATIKEKETLRRMVRGVGIPARSSTPLIVYCNTAQLAGLNYLVLHRILGYSKVKVYDGSMLEYCQMDLPLERFSWGSGPSGRCR